MSEQRPPWVSAVRDLEALQHAAEALSLLEALDRAELTAHLAAGATVEELAAVGGVAPPRLSAVLGVLASHGLVEESAGRWQLLGSWGSLARGETPVAWSPRLAAGHVQREGYLAALSGAQDYWSLSAADRLTMALAMSFDPSSTAAVEMIRGTVESIPGTAEALAGGGRVLELGCGVASRLTAVLLAFPTATAVGVELTEDLAEHGYERAGRLGVADRLEIHVVDAAEYEPEGTFDNVQWSQFFFPEPSRIGTLATARMALRPGAWLTSPVVWDGTARPAGSAEDRELAHMRLLLDLWGVPTRSTGEVAAELEAAGFVNVSVDQLPGIHRVRGCQP